jgi:uncharacterized repeat protein (TIGR01451 family)
MRSNAGRTSRLSMRVVLGALLTLALAIGIGASSALSGSNVGSFEIDGNTVDNSGPGEPIDWATPPPNLTTFTDDTLDTNFTGGSKWQDPAGWECSTGSVPAKDDIVNGAVAFRTFNGSQFAYVNFTRQGTNGSANIDYEFNQSNAPNPSCPELPQRTVGDIVIAFDQSGNSLPVVRVLQWNGSGFNALPVGAMGVTWDGAVNATRNFGEAAINLSTILGRTLNCGDFASVHMDSRASDAVNAALKDRTITKPVNVGGCPTSSMDKNVRNETAGGSFANTATASPGDTLEYQIKYTNGGSAPATNVKITDQIAPGQTYVAGSCTGGCTFDANTNTISWTIASVAPGDTVDLRFKVTVNPDAANGATIKNVAVVTTNEEPGSTNSDETTVTVSAAPKSALKKEVRNVTTNGSFGTSTDASPGDTLEYQLTYTNTGSGPATNVVISDPIPNKTTFVSCSDTCTQTGNPVTSVSWTIASVAPGGTVTRTFQVKLDSTGFTAGQSTPITNKGTVDTAEEPPVDSPPATVNVKTPSSSLAKAVRNVTTNGSFAGTANASPGDTIEYRLTYTNAGPGTAHNVVISDPVPNKTTFVSCSDTCTQTGNPVTSVSWTIASVGPNQTVTRTFQVKLDDSFPTGSTPVSNVAKVCTDEEGCKETPPTIVTVTAKPNLAVSKSAGDVTQATPGSQITYTLTYSNTGNAPATGTTITEAIPAGTMFASCSDSCTQTGGSPPTGVTWDIGTVDVGETASVTLTVEVLNSVGCQICNTAQISSPDQDNNATIDSNQVCVNSTPGPNPAGAHANGNAYGAHIQEGLLNINTTLGQTSSAQSGVGVDAHQNSVLSPRIPSDGSLLNAAILRGTSTSTVSEQPAQAVNTSTGALANVRVLTVAGVPTVSADAVQATATTIARGDGSSFTSNGSGIVNLRVLGQPVTVKPNLRIDLPNLLGTKGYVAIDEEIGSTSGPAANQLSGGTYAANLEVNMIRVHLDDSNLLKGGKQPLDIIVGHAAAHSDFPQTRLCTSGPTQAVSGHAFIASETTDPPLLPILVGFVGIPSSGGSAQQGVANVPGTLINAGAADSSSSGTNAAGSSTATSYAQAANVCLRLGQVNCVIGATLVRSQANSSATAAARSSNSTGTQLLGLTVGGQLIMLTPQPNTVIRIPGLATVILNEQFCDNGGTLAGNCSNGTVPGHTGITVRALRVILLDPAAGGPPGAEVIVAEAHSDATYR